MISKDGKSYREGFAVARRAMKDDAAFPGDVEVTVAAGIGQNVLEGQKCRELQQR